MPPSRYTKAERLAIGQRIYSGELTRFAAAALYGIDETTARNYMRLYRDTHHLPPKNTAPPAEGDLADTMEGVYAHMSREELLQEIFRLRLALAEKKE